MNGCGHDGAKCTQTNANEKLARLTTRASPLVAADSQEHYPLAQRQLLEVKRMSSPSPDPKALKKSLKAEIKQAKKSAKIQQATAASAAEKSDGLTPAERSAAAAEKQVRLQRWRVVLAVAGVLVAAATLLFTLRPWE